MVSIHFKSAGGLFQCLVLKSGTFALSMTGCKYSLMHSKKETELTNLRKGLGRESSKLKHMNINLKESTWTFGFNIMSQISVRWTKKCVMKTGVLAGEDVCSEVWSRKILETGVLQVIFAVLCIGNEKIPCLSPDCRSHWSYLLYETHLLPEMFCRQKLWLDC